jgi:hypothetical protein
MHRTDRFLMILVMVYNTENHWISELCLSFSILKIMEHSVYMLDLFLPSGEGKETHCLLDTLERSSD